MALFRYQILFKTKPLVILQFQGPKMKRKGQDIRTFFKKRSVNQRETEEVETQKDSQSVEEETQKVSQSVELETQKASQSVEVETQKDSPEPPEDTTSPTGPHGMSQIR